MKYRPLGRTGMNVSEVSFGAWAIGGSWGSCFCLCCVFLFCFSRNVQNKSGFILMNLNVT